MKQIAVIIMMALYFKGGTQVVETVLVNSSVSDGMCTDSSGNVYTTSGGLAGFVVGKYLPASNQFIHDFIPGLVGPTDVEFLSDSVMVITNYDVDRISAYNFNTGVLSTLAEGAGLDGPGGIEAHQDGYVYVTNWGNAPQYAGHTITKISPSGNSWTYIDTSALYRPQAITWNQDGQLVVHSNSKLYKVNAVDSTLQYWVSLPSGVGNMVFNSADSCIYGASPSAGQILKITAQGEVSVFAGSSPGYKDGFLDSAQFEGTLGLTFSPTHDTLYVSEAGNLNRLRRIVLKEPLSLEGSPSIAGVNIDIYPNPIMEGKDLIIQYDGPKELNSVVLLNASGQVVYTQFARNTIATIPSAAWQLQHNQVLCIKINFTDGSYEIRKLVR